MVGAFARKFLREAAEWAESTSTKLHYTTAREMVNIILAACDGCEGNPGDYRDYRLHRIA